MLYFIFYVGGIIMVFMVWINMGINNLLFVGMLVGLVVFVYVNVVLFYMFFCVDVFYYLVGLVVVFIINGLVYIGGFNNIGFYFIFFLFFI